MVNKIVICGFLQEDHWHSWILQRRGRASCPKLWILYPRCPDHLQWSAKVCQEHFSMSNCSCMFISQNQTYGIRIYWHSGRYMEETIKLDSRVVVTLTRCSFFLSEIGSGSTSCAEWQTLTVNLTIYRHVRSFFYRCINIFNTYSHIHLKVTYYAFYFTVLYLLFHCQVLILNTAKVTTPVSQMLREDSNIPVSIASNSQSISEREIGGCFLVKLPLTVTDSRKLFKPSVWEEHPIRNSWFKGRQLLYNVSAHVHGQRFSLFCLIRPEANVFLQEVL